MEGALDLGDRKGDTCCVLVSFSLYLLESNSLFVRRSTQLRKEETTVFYLQTALTDVEILRRHDVC
jgi:hypothetical protein